MSNNVDNLAVVDYFVKLCAKKKIVWINDVHRKDRATTPDFIRAKYLSNSLKSVLNSSYALGKDLRCVTVRLGELKKQSIVVFNTKNEAHVKKCLSEFAKLSKELDELEREHAVRTDVLKRKMLKIGGRFD